MSEDNFERTIDMDTINSESRKDRNELLPQDNLGNTFFERFEGKYGFSFEISEENLSKGLWFKKREKWINLFLEFGATWIAAWHDIITDMGVEVSKMTLSRLLHQMNDETLIGLRIFRPRSKKMNLTKIYYAYDKINKLEAILNKFEIMDDFYHSREKKKSPRDIVDHNFEVKKETILREKDLWKEIREIEKTVQSKRKEEADEEKKKRQQDIKNGLICPSDATKGHLRKMKNQTTKYTAGRHMGKEVNWLDQHFESCKMPFNKHSGI